LTAEWLDLTPASCLRSEQESCIVPSWFWEILFIFLLILFNGFFAAAEIAIVAARKSRLQQRADDGDRAAATALALATDPNRFLPTVQVGITLVSTLAAVFAGKQLSGRLEEAIAQVPIGFIAANANPLATGTVVICITILSLIMGELVPKRLALRYAESLARFVAPFMNQLSRVARPFVWLMGATTDAVLFLLRTRAASEPSVSVDDIEHLIESGRAEGVVEALEQRVAIEALRLGDRTVRDIMRPRIDLDALDVNTPADEVIGSVAMAGFSRVPVYEKDLDHIIGFIHIKDLFRQQCLGWPIELRKLLHPALFVPETMPLDRLLQLMQEKHNQLAIVLDEYGGTEGMVTLEDVVQELVGEIRDEHRRNEEQHFVERDDGSWLIDGSASFGDFVERLDIRGVTESRGFSTVSGLILDRLGRIPSVGDRAEWNGYMLEVVDMDGQRIDRILVSRVSSPERQEPAA
jgi:putative hemolysin